MVGNADTIKINLNCKHSKNLFYQIYKHRRAHCDGRNGSPYVKDGYYLVRESKDRPFVELTIQ